MPSIPDSSNVAMIAFYHASIANRLLSSGMEFIETSTNHEREKAMSADFFRTPAPSMKNGDTDARLRAWSYLIFERALSRFGKVRDADSDRIEEWLRSHYSVYKQEGLGETCKVFRLEARLDELGQVRWGFQHPEDGYFPVALGRNEAGVSMEDYLTSIARMDLLEKASELGATL